MKENKEMRLEYMAEVVGKTNDTVVQCKNCKCLVKYAKSDVEYTSTHFSKSNIEFSIELICPCCHMKIRLGNTKWIPSNSIKTKPGSISSYLPRLKDL